MLELRGAGAEGRWLSFRAAGTAVTDCLCAAGFGCWVGPWGGSRRSPCPECGTEAGRMHSGLCPADSGRGRAGLGRGILGVTPSGLEGDRGGCVQGSLGSGSSRSPGLFCPLSLSAQRGWPSAAPAPPAPTPQGEECRYQGSRHVLSLTALNGPTCTGDPLSLRPLSTNSSPIAVPSAGPELTSPANAGVWAPPGLQLMPSSG